MDVGTPELLHGLRSIQTETELGDVQVLLREAQDGFTNRGSLSTFTQTLTTTLGQVHSFEATYYLIYQTGQTVQATWVIYDRMRADPVQIAFCRAMQLKTTLCGGFLLEGARYTTCTDEARNYGADPLYSYQVGGRQSGGGTRVPGHP